MATPSNREPAARPAKGTGLAAALPDGVEDALLLEAEVPDESPLEAPEELVLPLPELEPELDEDEGCAPVPEQAFDMSPLSLVVTHTWLPSVVVVVEPLAVLVEEEAVDGRELKAVLVPAVQVEGPGMILPSLMPLPFRPPWMLTLGSPCALMRLRLESPAQQMALLLPSPMIEPGQQWPSASRPEQPVAPIVTVLDCARVCWVRRAVMRAIEDHMMSAVEGNSWMIWEVDGGLAD